jgi:hypothetical protein
LQSADRALKDARAAASNAQQRLWAARSTVDELRERPVPQADANSLISNLAGGDFDICTLDKPQVDARAALEQAEREMVAWQSARDLAEQTIPGRETALGMAHMTAESAARELVRAETPIAALLGEGIIPQPSRTGR